MDKDDMDDMDALQDEIAKLERDKDNLTDELHETRMERDDLQDKLDAAEMENDDLHRDVLELRAEISKFERGTNYPG